MKKLATKDIIFQECVEHTKSILKNGKINFLAYHVDIGSGWDTVSGFEVKKKKSSKGISFIEDVFAELDPLIDLDFAKVSSLSDADIKIYQISEFSSEEEADTLGLAMTEGGVYEPGVNPFWSIFWKHSSKGDIDSFDLVTVPHEIGHVLGLDHPMGDGYKLPWTTDDSIMSYNKPKGGWNPSFTSLDIKSLQSLWGKEANPIQADGSDKDEKFFGTHLGDLINAGAGNDTIKAAGGSDQLSGGTGKNKIWGGKGKDVFSLSSGKGFDVIMDFSHGSDKITYQKGMSGLFVKEKKGE